MSGAGAPGGRDRDADPGARRPAPGARSPLTVLVTARDEEELLGGALASVAGLADEVLLVLDPATRDRTREVALAAGARVLEHPFESSAAQCNWGLDRCSNRWVLVLDADERVDPLLREAVRAALADPRHDAYVVGRANFAFGKPLRFGDWGHDRIARLLDRERARFVELAVHGAVRAASTGVLAGRLEHHTLRSLEQYLPKVTDYARRGAADLVAAGRRAGPARALAHALWRLLRGLVVRGGVLDGPRGWAVAALLAHGTLLKWLLAWDAQRHARSEGPRATTHEPRTTTHEPRTTNHEPRTTSGA